MGAKTTALPPAEAEIRTDSPASEHCVNVLLYGIYDRVRAAFESPQVRAEYADWINKKRARSAPPPQAK